MPKDKLKVTTPERPKLIKTLMEAGIYGTTEIKNPRIDVEQGTESFVKLMNSPLEKPKNTVTDTIADLESLLDFYEKELALIEKLTQPILSKKIVGVIKTFRPKDEMVGEIKARLLSSVSRLEDLNGRLSIIRQKIEL